jgi:hypothetical protein
LKTGANRCKPQARFTQRLRERGDEGAFDSYSDPEYEKFVKMKYF